MTDSLEAEFDSLFRLPPAEVVAARNSFASRLKKAGDKAGAARIAAVKRPTPAAWAINQVHFREPALLERAKANAAEVRELHAKDGVDGRQLAAAVEALRGATQAIVDAAVRFCESARIANGAQQERKIYITVQSWLSGTADEQPGRMTHEVEASGFDALGSVGVVLPPLAAARLGGSSAASSGGAKGSSAATQSRSEAPSVGPDTRALDFATDQLARREREARAALERVRERAAAQKEAERELERARQQVKDAERALSHLRAAAMDRAGKLQQAEAATKEAEEDRVHAEEAVGQARIELANLRRS